MTYGRVQTNTTGFTTGTTVRNSASRRLGGVKISYMTYYKLYFHSSSMAAQFGGFAGGALQTSGAGSYPEEWALFDSLHSNELGAGCKSRYEGTRLTQSQVEAEMRKAGWAEANIPTGAAVFMAESGGWTGAVNPCGSDYSVGLAQINIKGALASRGSEAYFKDPQNNLRFALTLFNSNHSFAPHWGAYTDGNYKTYLGKGGGSSTAASDGAASGAFQLASTGGLILLVIGALVLRSIGE